MRALLDTNIYISYLLPSAQERPIQQVVEAAVKGEFTLLIPHEMIREFSERVASKKYLARRILPQEAAEFMSTLAAMAETTPEIGEPIPRVTRDAKDDYLLAHALIGQADYLVTGDYDLLVLREIGEVKIVRPAEFLRVLRAETGKQ